MEGRDAMKENAGRAGSTFSFDRLSDRALEPKAVSAVARGFYKTTLSMIDEFMGMLDRWTYETRTHSWRATHISLKIGEKLGMTPRDLFSLGVGALLHDVGKIRIPREILLKPERLSEEEWMIMKLHPELGGFILDRFPSLHFAKELVVQHQERWNGSGYPRGLKGKEIVQGARIFAVADSYDAMTTRRAYNAIKNHEEALLELSMNAGILYDPEVVHHFLEIDAAYLWGEEAPFKEEGILEALFPAERFIQLVTE
jgi:HD-GYP domain-containing protein (c-di-GMP phosphodiesterase class II)